MCACASGLRSVCSTVYSAADLILQGWAGDAEQVAFLMNLLVAFTFRRPGTKQGRTVSAWTPLTVALTQLTFRLPAQVRATTPSFRGYVAGRSRRRWRSQGGDGARSRMLIWQPGSTASCQVTAQDSVHRGFKVREPQLEQRREKYWLEIFKFQKSYFRWLEENSTSHSPLLCFHWKDK